MPLLQLSQVCLAYGHVPLLDHADLVIEAGERVGLIGRNGTGKSSLLKIIEGTGRADDGKVWLASGIKLAFVPQEPAFPPGLTVFEAVAEGLGEGTRLLVEYHDATHALAAHPGGPSEEALMARLHELQEALEAAGGWTLQHRIEATLTRVALPEDAMVDDLSGGMKKRVALARALVLAPDLLLLDEPTNHLDIAAIEWLEETLVSFTGAVLFVTHDRRFLDRVAQRIVELDRGRLADYPGNFSAYEARKAEQLAVEAVVNRKFDKVLAQEEAWIRKGVEARRTRNEGRVRRLEALRLERAARRERVGKVGIALSPGERSGRLVTELEDVTKRFGEKRVVEKFSTRILRGDKIGFIGPNGCGKSTLLKLILGRLAPDAGSVRLGTKVAVAYFDQFRAALDEEATLADTISPGSDFIEIDGGRKHVIGYLGDFLFPPERANAPVKTLSGGERNRLLLARLFSRPANVLVLDEPTNDLDIETLELLESLLQDYAGTLFLVSHDRAFLDNVVTQTIAFEGEGRWKEYAGGYGDWQRARTGASRDARKPPVEGGADESPRTDTRAPRRKTKLGFNELRELEQLPGKLEALEREQKELADRLGDPAIYQDRSVDLKALNERHAAIEGELTRLLARWEELEAKKAALS
ncbi:MAG TPA: ATP-binding cassette domain-containing protein [Usitatibacteraceae bacterium]|nr:ATP-binding cassette domain-containing protein [Usitatibacteraceae bacterium]